MDTSAFELGLRVALSLACVLGVIWFAGRRMAGTATARKQRASTLSVVGRQSLGGKTGVALVEVSGRRLLLGVSEHGVNLLAEVEIPVEELASAVERVELDPAELVLADLGVPSDFEVAPTLSAFDDPSEVDVPFDLSGLDGLAPHDETVHTVRPTVRPAPAVRGTAPTSTPAARMPAVPTPRSPLEGSILDAATWRRAMAAVQERTIRR
ncbi:flagellar biosynthetic protein FliO [Actinotalea sp. K2]|uniref:flagellar biosynthetic protein FliO n=1 Tax=Actinotalea sp. K2 TaxID=2939438 RepID=UPI00201772FF|nr:flagellar biosynthetic protein FliO [Actinotalea sp. K2]MCL3860870.1 flagellar biosynthetic protein FliO [Actinotalea sp. K2]